MGSMKGKQEKIDAAMVSRREREKLANIKGPTKLELALLELALLGGTV